MAVVVACGVRIIYPYNISELTPVGLLKRLTLSKIMDDPRSWPSSGRKVDKHRLEEESDVGRVQADEHRPNMELIVHSIDITICGDLLDEGDW